MMQPDYADIQQLLAQEHSLADAAEAHGTLAGCLCGASGYRFEDWLKRDPARGAGDRGRDAPACANCSTRRRRRCIQPDMEFEPLLPDDEAAARGAHRGARRVVPGFPLRTGRGQHPGCERAARGGRRGGARLHRDQRTPAVDAEPGEESNENAYAELVEFVRVGVQLLFEELRERAPPGRSPPATPLH